MSAPRKWIYSISFWWKTNQGIYIHFLCSWNVNFFICRVGFGMLCGDKPFFAAEEEDELANRAAMKDQVEEDSNEIWKLVYSPCINGPGQWLLRSSSSPFTTWIERYFPPFFKVKVFSPMDLDKSNCFTIWVILLLLGRQFFYKTKQSRTDGRRIWGGVESSMWRAPAN